jgi:hypothetical protein
VFSAENEQKHPKSPKSVKTTQIQNSTLVKKTNFLTEHHNKKERKKYIRKSPKRTDKFLGFVGSKSVGNRRMQHQ